MRTASIGQWVFAATMAAIGLMGLIKADFAPVWAPVPKSAPAREALIWISALVSLGSGLGLLWRRSAPIAARLLLAALLIWLLAFRVPVIVHAPGSIDAWENGAETLVVVAGAWALYDKFAGRWDRRRLGFATGGKGLRLARTLYGLALVVFGLSHFAYLKETASLVPRWLPGHLAWAAFTGGAYIAAGVAIVTGVLARLAASLCALQIAGFTLLVWAPIIATAKPDAFQWSETVISWTLTAAAVVIAETYRGRPWLTLRAR